MANDLMGLAGRMAVLSDGVVREATRVKRKVALTIDQTVVLETPVDKGRARANWIASSGAPEGGERIQVGDGISAGDAANLAIDQARAAISRAVGDIFISNNVPYIVPLNNGHSAQAPAGMVERAVQAGLAVARTEKIRISRG
jgi:hypothetical protein